MISSKQHGICNLYFHFHIFRLPLFLCPLLVQNNQIILYSKIRCRIWYTDITEKLFRLQPYGHFSWSSSKKLNCILVETSWSTNRLLLSFCFWSAKCSSSKCKTYTQARNMQELTVLWSKAAEICTALHQKITATQTSLLPLGTKEQFAHCNSGIA